MDWASSAPPARLAPTTRPGSALPRSAVTRAVPGAMQSSASTAGSRIPDGRPRATTSGATTHATTALAAWILHLRGHGAPVKDPGAEAARTAANMADLPAAVSDVLDTLSDGLGTDLTLVETIVSQMDAVTAER